MLVPVVGVDFVADDDVAEALDAVDGRGLVVGVGLLVDGVGRAKVEGVDADLGAEEAFGEVELEVDLGVGDFADVRVSEGVVADLVAFVVDPLHDADVVLGDLTDHEEGAFDVVLLEHVEDARRPFRVGTVVEGEGYLLGVVAVKADGVGQRVGVHDLLGDHLERDGNLIVVIEGDATAAGLWFAGDAEDVADAFVVDGVAGLDGGEVLEGFGVGGGVPDLPDGVVFGAEAPEGEGIDAELAGGAHLVEDGDGVEEPDLVADVPVVVIVGEVSVHGVGVELDLCAGVGGGLPGVLGGASQCAEDFRLGRRGVAGLRLAVRAGEGGGGRAVVQSQL